MIKLLAFGAISLLAVAAPVFAAAERDAMMEKEKAIWQSVQDKKFDGFRKYFASDYRAAYAQGIYNIDQEMDSVQKADLKSFSLSDSTVVMPDKDTALLTYKSTTQGTQGGKDMSGTWNCASVWHKSGAEWKVVFHTEVKAQ
ncbi:MAG TPA: nuclear transport factor 2 family protein [Chthoniobacterales bacterium]|nr:nuclear transport factor 2 family protein [Chthoniobacterales bacterium]